MLAVGTPLLLYAVFFTACLGAIDSRIVQLPWTTDSGACLQPNVNEDINAANDNCGPLGPDGPWQAPLLWLLGQPSQPRVAVYPHNEQWTTVVSTAAGGVYDENLISNDNITYTHQLTNESFRGGLRNDAALVGRTAKNLTLNLATEWNITLPNKEKYPRKNGLIGLTHPSIGDRNLLRQLMDSNETANASWALHMGSAWLQQPGSLTLGGYDANRLCGDVAEFDIHDARSGPRITLVDMLLGVEEGGSPYGTKLDLSGGINNGTVWKTAGSNRTIPVEISARDPGIYLPEGTCKELAKYLPVIWRDDIGYYVWNTTDSRYKPIVTSPAWLGFTFEDRTQEMLTIKVPFILLNLTLEAPIVTKPMPYFPCHEVGTTPTPLFTLGRAFLQAAFLGYNYDQNMTYLAQGVGPDMESSTLLPFPSRDSGATMDYNSMITYSSQFASSWYSTWTPLPGGDDDNWIRKRRLSKGEIAGIAVGCIAVLTIVIGALWMLWRRRQRRIAALHQQHIPTFSIGRRRRGELEGDYPALEMEGQGAKQELEAPNATHEVKGSDVVPVFELEGEWWKERPVVIGEDSSQSDESECPPRYSWDQSEERISVGSQRRRGSMEKQEVAEEEEKEEEKEGKEEKEVSPLESQDNCSPQEADDCSPMDKNDSYPPDVER